MCWHRFHGKEWFAILSLFFFFSCSKPCQEWEFGQVVTPCPCYNSGRLFLPTTDPSRGLEIEIIHASSNNETLLYLGAYSLEFTGTKENPNKTLVTVTIDEQSIVVAADRLEGGQKLLMPPEATQTIINALLENRVVRLKTGRYQTEILNANFCELYYKLISSP